MKFHPLQAWPRLRKGELSQSQPQIPLRLVLTLPFVLQTVGTVALVGYLSFRSGQQAVADLAEQLMVESGDRVVQKLEDYFAVPQYVTQTMAYNLQAGLLDGFDLATLEPHLTQQLKILPNLSAVAIANEDREFLVVERSQPPQLVIRKLDAASPDRAFYRYITDGNGQNPVLQGIRHNYDPHNDPPGDPWYREAQNHPQGIWRLAVSLSRGESSPYLQLARFLPFYNAQGKFQGVVASGVSLEQLGAFLQNLNMGHHGQVFLMEEDGMLVATSAEEIPFDSQPNPDHAQNVSVRPRRLAAIQSQDPLTRAIAQQLIQQGSLTRFTQPQSSILRFNNQRYFVRVTPLTGELDWLSVMVVPESDFMAAIHTNVYRTTFLCGLALLGSVGLGLWAARRISQPMMTLHNAVQGFAVGQAISPLGSSRIQEVDALRMAFHQMMTQLNSSFRALQENQQTLETFLDSVPVGVSVHSPSGQIVFMNKKGKEILRQDLLTATIAEMSSAYQLYIAGTEQLYPTEQLPATRTLRGETTYIDDIEIDIDGRRIPTEVYTIPVFDKEGNVVYAINAFQDTTERRQAEQLRASYNRELERQVAEQTQALRDSQTQLQQFTDAIQRSEAQLRLLTDSLPVFIAYADTEERYKFVNLAYERQFGLSREEILGRHTRDIVGEASYTLSQPYIKQVLAGESPHYDITLPTATGKERHLSVMLIPDFDDQAQVRGFYSLVIDISDRKVAEQALQRYERIVSATTDAISLVDRNYHYQIVNQAYLDWNNKAYSEIVGHSVAELMGQDVFEDALKPLLDRCLAGETVQYSEWFDFPAMGRQFVSVTYAPFLEADQTISGIVVSVRNITPLKEAEEALRYSEERFRSAFHDAPIGMALIGLDNHWLKVNPMLCEMFGYTEAEILSIDLATLVHPDDRAVLQTYREQLRMGENHAKQEKLRYVRKDGQIAWGLISVSLVRSEDKPSYYVAQIQDITEQYAIDRMKNEFISIVSHELRTPLTAIRGFLGLLDTGIYDNQPDKAKRMVHQAVSNTDRLVRLVNDILDLERLSSGKVPLMMAACDVENLMRRAVAELQPIADKANITFIINAVSAQVWASEDGIIQTLTNLLSNAIKFSPAGSQILLSAEIQTETVLFSVKDQGRGIPSEKLETIFGRFQQVDVSDSRQKGGTGLGLAICQSIIQQHGGNIWAESTLGEGSTFYFTLLLHH